jgi:hypothetical protein
MLSGSTDAASANRYTAHLLPLSCACTTFAHLQQHQGVVLREGRGLRNLISNTEIQVSTMTTSVSRINIALLDVVML